MTTKFNNFIAELRIRFGDDWTQQPILTPGHNAGRETPRIYFPEHSWDDFDAYNRWGNIYEGGVWATALITHAPEAWVVEKDIDHPVWRIFQESVWNLPGCENERFDQQFFSDSDASDNLLDFQGYQYLTLDQWHKLIYIPQTEKDL